VKVEAGETATAWASRHRSRRGERSNSGPEHAAPGPSRQKVARGRYARAAASARM